MRNLRTFNRHGRATLVVGLLSLSAFALGAMPAAGSPPPSRPEVASPGLTAPSAVPGGPAAGRPGTPAPGNPVPADPGAPLALPPGVTPQTPPEPHVITTFAGQLQGPRRGAGPPGRGLSVPVRPDIDGCDRNYGEAAQCVPKTLPGGQTDLCAYLAQRGFKGVRVKGTDARGIDRNGNGVVCD